MNFFKNLNPLVILGVIFGAYILISSLYILRLKGDMKEKDSQILTLRVQNKECELSLIKQNSAILALKNEITDKNENAEKIEEVKKIYIKDSSCESELKAYKELFK